MDHQKKISIAVINRLPRYYRYLKDLLDNNITRISSKDLSNQMNITASQIRQDLNNFGGFGQQGYGYNVEYLYSEIQKILGLENQYNMIIVGAGNIGQALANYPYFEENGFAVTAMFDINPKIIGMAVRGIPVYDLDDLESFVEANKTDIAVLAVPRASALDVAKRLELCGINGIWNFSQVDLELGKQVTTESVHLTDSLMTLSYRLNDNPTEELD